MATTTLTIVQIRKQLDNWLAPGATLPSHYEYERVASDWLLQRHTAPKGFWAIIEDRCLLVKRKIGY